MTVKDYKKSVYSFSDLAEAMNQRFNNQGTSTPQRTGNVQYTPPVPTTKPKRKMRVVGRTGYPAGDE